MRPRIGITSWHRNDADRLERWVAIRDTYTGAVRAAGGLPIILPIGDDDPELIDGYLAAVDGLLFTGGEDIAPAYYGEARDERCQEPDPERDLFEIHLARAGLDRRVPVLGICRGLQILNVAAGGTLYQDIACRPGTAGYHSASLADRGRLIHGVRLVPGTRLRRDHGRRGVRGDQHTPSVRQGSGAGLRGGGRERRGWDRRGNRGSGRSLPGGRAVASGADIQRARGTLGAVPRARAGFPEERPTAG